MLKKSWLFLLPLVASLLWVGAGPSQATGATWSITGVTSVGCTDGDWELTVHFAGLDTGAYIWHTEVTSNGKVYMNEGFSQTETNGDGNWGLYSDYSYATVPNPGAYPMTPGVPMTVHITVERPKGTVLYGWTLVASSCSSSTLTFNGADRDGDAVGDARDACPGLYGATSNGCPVRNRTLTLKVKHSPNRLVGRLYAAGYPALYADRVVTIWKVRPGRDLKVAKKRTSATGGFRLKVGNGRYYAKSKGLIVATAGQATAVRSPKVRVH